MGGTQKSPRMKVKFVVVYREAVIEELFLEDEHNEGAKLSAEPSDLVESFDDAMHEVFLNPYAWSLFLAFLTEPRNVSAFLNYSSKFFPNCKSATIKVSLTEPQRHFIDWKSNEMCTTTGIERRELDHALAWFSTFGGAFSALGDTMTRCAVIAGKISTRQFQIALRLGDPLLASRCRLYFALSLIQQGHFKLARSILLREHAFARSQVEFDPKLLAMARGIWSKWKYDRGKWEEKKRKSIKQI